MPGITGVSITAEPGQIVAPPPDGASYLGFIFARTPTPAAAEAALRAAHACLDIVVAPLWKAVPAAGRPASGVSAAVG